MFLCHRSQRHRARAWASPASPPIASTPSAIAISLLIIFRPRRYRHAPLAPRRRFRPIRFAGILLRHSSRRILHRQQPDAAKEKSRCLGTSARQDRAASPALFSALFTTLKGLPTSYQRDLQEDKEALFAAHDQLALPCSAWPLGAVSATKFNEKTSWPRPQPIPRFLPPKPRIIWSTRAFPFVRPTISSAKLLREAERQGKTLDAVVARGIQ